MSTEKKYTQCQDCNGSGLYKDDPFTHGEIDCPRCGGEGSLPVATVQITLEEAVELRHIIRSRGRSTLRTKLLAALRELKPENNL